jgi:hypothetical protein
MSRRGPTAHVGIRAPVTDSDHQRFGRVAVAPHIVGRGRDLGKIPIRIEQIDDGVLAGYIGGGVTERKAHEER